MSGEPPASCGDSPGAAGALGTPPGLLAAVLGLAAGGGDCPTTASAEQQLEEQEQQAGCAGEEVEEEAAASGWDSDGDLTAQLAVTALSQPAPPSALATVAASRAPPGLGLEEAYMTPMPLPNWLGGGGGEDDEADV